MIPAFGTSQTDSRSTGFIAAVASIPPLVLASVSISWIVTLRIHSPFLCHVNRFLNSDPYGPKLTYYSPSEPVFESLGVDFTLQKFTRCLQVGESVTQSLRIERALFCCLQCRAEGVGVSITSVM